MRELKTFKLFYRNDGAMCMAIVVAEKDKEAEELLKKEHMNPAIHIEKIEEVLEKGVALVWRQPMI